MSSELMLRLLKSLVASGLVSITSLLLAALVARTGGTSSLGEFAVAYSAYMMVQLVAREAGVTPLLGSKADAEVIRNQCRRQSLIGIVGAIILLSFGLISGSFSLIIIGFFVHGMVVLNYSRLLSLTLGNGRRALHQDCAVLLFVVISAVLISIYDLNYVVVIVVWSCASSVLGYVAAHSQKYRLAPSWLGRGEESKVGLSFAVQSLIGAGSINILTFILAALSGPILVGTLKGGSTLLGPANVVTTAVQPLAIRSLVVVRTSSRMLRFKMMIKLSSGLTGLYLAVAVPTLFGARYFGEYILGSTWFDVQPVFMIMVLDGFLAAILTVPAAAHRALWASAIALRVSLFLLFIRFPLVIFGAASGGVEGAAWGYMISTAVSAIAWWLSAVIISPRK